LTMRFSSPSRMNAWGCSVGPCSPETGMRDHRSCSTVTKALWMCGYLETRCVPRCSANRSGIRICGEIFAMSGVDK
jgi:hypothetical protein